MLACLQELVLKIAILAEKNAPNFGWYVDVPPALLNMFQQPQNATNGAKGIATNGARTLLGLLALLLGTIQLLGTSTRTLS